MTKIAPSFLFSLFRRRYVRVAVLVTVIFGLSNHSAGDTRATTKISLNGQWDYRLNRYSVGEEERWFESDAYDGSWILMEVPGNWDTRNEYSSYTGAAWYRFSLDLPEDSKNKRARLVFEAVSNDCVVWLNGEKVGEDNFGFLPFHFEVGDLLRHGEMNTIVLRVENAFKRGAMWSWGGRRPVWLNLTERQRLEGQRIQADPDLSAGNAVIDIAIQASSLGAQSIPLEAGVRILGPDGRLVGSKQIELGVIGEGLAEVTVGFDLGKDEVALWHFNDPNLYRSIVELLRAGEVIHCIEDRFGIRKLEIEGSRLKLSGERVRLVGFNVVPEDRMTGNTLPDWRIREDVDLMKSLGANMASGGDAVGKFT